MREVRRTADRSHRQQQVLERLEAGTPVKKIAKDLGVTRSAVYQTIDRLRGSGAIPPDFTPSGALPRSQLPAAGGAPLSGAPSPSPTQLADLRAMESDADPGYADVLAAAISARHVPTLAYELGRADAGQRSELSRQMIEAALRDTGAMPANRQPRETG